MSVNYEYRFLDFALQLQALLFINLLLLSIILVLLIASFTLIIGPGTYYKHKQWPETKSLERINKTYESNKHKDLMVKPQPRAPSIPAKKIA